MFNSLGDCIKYINETGVEELDFKMVDLMGRWRHVSAPAASITQDTMREGFGFDASNLGFKNIEKSDMITIPDPVTAFEEDWEGIRVLSFMCNVHVVEGDEARFAQDPRYVCHKAEEQLKHLDLGEKLMFLPELEFYVLDNVSFGKDPEHSFYYLESESAGWSPDMNNLGYYNRKGKGYQVSPPSDALYVYRQRLVKMLRESGVRVKYHHHEVGAPGQMEIEVDFNTPTRSADSIMLLKHIARNLARTMGKTVTFMPKPIYGEAGSGMHIHFKLYRHDRNLFAGEGYGGLSDIARYFIGGILSHARSLMAFTNPSTNSYKRLVPGYEAPVSLVYATANRSAAIRIPGYAKQENDRRFEYRPPDASCNPYLAFAALIMAGIDGMKKEIDPITKGFGPFDGNLYNMPEEERKVIRKLPLNLEESLNALEDDHQYLLEGGVFCRELIDNWIKTKLENEVKAVEGRPHPYEYEMYFDA